ncbi:aldehyde ferredoxin oxidoreductase C-terminal domain-containing protein [Desulforhopalus singaporensis]|uniref:Aldehyde:ferredoxin oxidoreductase n=1 Tax=Desulforhopalus singaporensis TaxID=91360 RepID=A0A1H0VLP5_9BACT|nr:aldehyde ferredoxin oxidoreductase C-terminal domain-containing protein [Desulforhopalus singaporensis]SDP79211.1 aldehyde:ferredoxin oxidoreductase [Desulforhopalus singaporensis]
MHLHFDPNRCYSCKTCQLICSYHHTGSFWPEKSSIEAYRNQQNGYVKWSVDNTCDGCSGESEVLCVKHCVYGALTIGAKQPQPEGHGKKLTAETDTGGSCLAGKILRVDLTENKIWTEDSLFYAQKTLGGRGINSMIMVNEIPAGTRWSDPQNLLCFGAGLLNGTMAPGACRVDISSISVFSGGKGSANVGGFFGPEMKYAGYDNIIISGKAPKPVYLYIRDDVVEIRDAEGLWGQTVFSSEAWLRETLGDPQVKTALIGPSGENRVRGSAVMIDGSRAAGGSGVGCVMGDKNLKAIAVRGTGKVGLADPARFMKAIDKCSAQCAREPNVVPMRKSLTNFYSDPDFEGWERIMVVRNGQDEYWEKEKRIELMNQQTGVPSMRKGMRACYLCPTGCSSYMEIDDGRFQGTRGEGFWVNTIMGHAARFDLSDPEAVVHAWLLTNEMGLDTDYVSSGLAWIFECYENGYITKDDTGGVELNWGDGDALVAMIKKLAYRQGIGDLLADGMLEAAKTIGHNSEYLLAHMKGQPSIEPFRVPKGWGLAVATSPICGRHLRGSTQGSHRFGPRPRPGKFGATEYEGQPEGVYWQARTKELEDNMGICNYVGTWSGGNYLTPGNFAELISSALGIEVTEKELMDHYACVGRNLEKAFNTLFTDLERKDDLPPERFRKEPVKSGPNKGFIADEEKYHTMLTEFYQLWEWDAESGLQTRDGLERLGLKNVADKLAAQGKLVQKKA